MMFWILLAIRRTALRCFHCLVISTEAGLGAVTALLVQNFNCSPSSALNAATNRAVDIQEDGWKIKGELDEGLHARFNQQPINGLNGKELFQNFPIKRPAVGLALFLVLGDSLCPECICLPMNFSFRFFGVIIIDNSSEFFWRQKLFNVLVLFRAAIAPIKSGRA